jgi:hypothetical protein
MTFDSKARAFIREERKGRERSKRSNLHFRVLGVLRGPFALSPSRMKCRFQAFDSSLEAKFPLHSPPVLGTVAHSPGAFAASSSRSYP